MALLGSVLVFLMIIMLGVALMPRHEGREQQHQLLERIAKPEVREEPKDTGITRAASPRRRFRWLLVAGSLPAVGMRCANIVRDWRHDPAGTIFAATLVVLAVGLLWVVSYLMVRLMHCDPQSVGLVVVVLGVVLGFLMMAFFA